MRYMPALVIHTHTHTHIYIVYNRSYYTYTYALYGYVVCVYIEYSQLEVFFLENFCYESVSVSVSLAVCLYMCVCVCVCVRFVYSTSLCFSRKKATCRADVGGGSRPTWNCFSYSFFYFEFFLTHCVCKLFICLSLEKKCFKKIEKKRLIFSKDMRTHDYIIK